jgi:bifunctional ADP-heptose synthase (sugar kinase/adenylyltransferase)
MSKAPALDKVRILVAGDVMLDRYWFGDVSRISPEAPVPVVRIERREARLGGAANVARNACWASSAPMKLAAKWSSCCKVAASTAT